MGAAYLNTPTVQVQHALSPYWCRGKESFASVTLAAEVARRSHKGARTVYKCSFCHAWHVGAGRGNRPKKIHGMNLVRSENG